MKRRKHLIVLQITFKIIGNIALNESGSPSRANRDMEVSGNNLTKSLEYYTSIEEPQYKEDCKTFGLRN